MVDALLAGLTNKKIAKRLRIAHNTVKVYFSRLFEKFGADSRFHLQTMFREPSFSAITGAGATFETLCKILQTINLTAQQKSEALAILLADPVITKVDG